MPRVLLIDDRPVVADALRRMLAHDFPELDVRLCRYVATALHAADRPHTIELVVARLSLPGTDALELMATLRARGVQAPLVVLAATGEEWLARAALDRGASGFVPEARPGPALATAARTVLAGRRAFPAHGLAPAVGVSDERRCGLRPFCRAGTRRCLACQQSARDGDRSDNA